MVEQQNNNQLYNIHGKLATVQEAESGSVQNRELIEKAMNGEKQAFSELYMLSYQYIYFVVRDYIFDDETIYDIIQETFIKVYKGITTLRSPDAYYSWITTIAKNTAKNFLRTKQYHIYIDDDEDYSAFLLNQDQTQKDVSLDIQTVLKELDTQDAELLSLVYYDGMTAPQIAKMRDIPVATVYTRLHRAKKKLKAQLSVHGIDKAIYSGNFMSMVTTAIRNIIGTTLLSLVIAQQILDSIINGKGKKELAVAKIIRSQQKKAVLKIASVIVAISMITSAATALTFVDWNRFKISEDKNNSTETVTEYHYYNEVEKGENSSYDNGGFWGNLFGSNGDSSISSTVSNNLNSSNFNPYYSNDSSNSSSGSSNTYSSKIPTANGSTPSYSTPDNSTSTDNTDEPAEVINVFGNNPNNVAAVFGTGSNNGLVAKQGEWLYYSQTLSRLMKVKVDGSEIQILYEAPGLNAIQCINVIGDTIYFVCGGIYKIKTDGTELTLIKNVPAYNFLVRGTTGWYVTYQTTGSLSYYDKFDLYQIDLLTGETIAIGNDLLGGGVKTVIDDYVIYASSRTVYTYNIKTGKNETMLTLDAENSNGDTIKMICNILIDGDIIYLTANKGSIFMVDFKTPSVIQNEYPFKYYANTISNYFKIGGKTMVYVGTSNSGFYTIEDGILQREIDVHDKAIYSFDDEYIYYLDDVMANLHRSKIDGSDLIDY